MDTQYACISGGKVVNKILADLEFIEAWDHNHDQIIECPQDACIGWSWSEESGFTAPPMVEITTEETTKEAGI